MALDQMQISHLLREWKEVHVYRVEWGNSVVKGGPYRTKAKCEASRLRALKSLGYTIPKWWQFWRWFEPALIGDIVQRKNYEK